MRCLQCGKGIPLLKRLGGSSEFCSDAHRREYQQEYSQLALGRLLQSNPNESQASTPAVDEPATANMNAKHAAKLSLAPAWAEKAHPATTLSALAAAPNRIAKSQPPPSIPVTKAVPLPAASQPATAELAAIQKPAPAESQFTAVAAPEFEYALASLAPNRPRRQPDTSRAELPHGPAVAWDSRVEITDSMARPTERQMDLREVSRTTPRVALDLRIVPPESLETENQPLTIQVAPTAPSEAFPWISPYCDFVGELVSLSGFADAQFAKSEFEAPPLAGGSTADALAKPLPPESQPAAVESQPPPREADASFAEPQTNAPAPTLRVPDPELDPLPVGCTGIAAPKAKALPVFGPAPVSAGAIHIPPPNGLPLRPVMVVATAAGPPAEVEPRKGDVLNLRSAPSIKPEIQQSKASALPSEEFNPGLPELRMPPLESPTASRTRKILAAVTGAAVLGAGLFFFLGNQSDAGLKSATPALADGALGGPWITNFASDAKRQRRVSVLRSSMNLSAYRLDFEGSIKIKALGWVYRAQDSKNFYVSKIEFQKPGVNPVYALVHYAVIDGVEQPRVETPLPVSVPMGGLYQIRFEAVGNRFTTWVQGQRVEQWTDPRLSSGGAGLYSEGVEQASLHGDFVVKPLVK